MTRSTFDATSDFYSASRMTRVFRWGLGTSQRLWPALAVRAAFRLFCTPLPPKWLNRRRSWSAEWRIERWPFEDASVTLYSLAADNTGPVVLLVHGWGGHAGQMLALADVMRTRGLRPVLVEMPAHGRSDGAISNIPHFVRALEYVAARLAQQGDTLRAVVAHSLGANAAAYAASRGLTVERLVLLAPPASPVEYTRLFARMFGLSETTRANMQRRLEAREGILMRQLEPTAVGPRIALPTLVVHDRNDSINLFADGVAYSEAIAGAQLVATEGLGHRRILKDPDVLEGVAAFLD